MILYCPSPSDTAVRTLSISAGLLASTVTPGNTAPVESLTDPAMLLDAVAWALRSFAAAVSAAMTNSVLIQLVDILLLLEFQSKTWVTERTASALAERM